LVWHGESLELKILGHSVVASKVSKNDHRAQVGALIFLKIIQNKHDNNMMLENGEV
jgi:hypothetical protein